jgi:hypothetical protein
MRALLLGNGPISHPDAYVAKRLDVSSALTVVDPDKHTLKSAHCEIALPTGGENSKLGNAQRANAGQRP